MEEHDYSQGQLYRSLDRRQVLSGGAALLAGGVAGCLGMGDNGEDDGSGDLTNIHMLNLEGSMFVPVFFYGREQDLWASRGIDLSIEVAGFGKFSRTFSEGLATGLSPLSSLPLAGNLAGDTGVKCFGQTMNFINQCFVQNDSDIEEPGDLEGMTVGVPGRGSSTTRYYIAQWAELYDFDLMNDPTEIVDSPTSTLYNFLEGNEEIDAGILFTGDTIKALANDDLRSIYNPVPAWEEQHGYPPSVTMFGVFDDFLNENPSVVMDFWDGWTEAVELFRDEFDQAMNQYGAVGGIDLSSEGEVDEVRQLVNEGQLFPTDWDEEWIQMNVDLFKLVEQYGGLDAAPDTDSFLTHEEIQDMS
ncbi:ABC transporter substrate-binding protein [Natronosalvus caseinilyticus]|uniref:ABC transporter substrate-binding protein n=1 Tax=Natronosalvus caseinilyticus TaxID=2953747 RepID=UPI0028B13CB2|nr:hypothetical protein [Natronosalvus caseinilyticus]